MTPGDDWGGVMLATAAAQAHTTTHAIPVPVPVPVHVVDLGLPSSSSSNMTHLNLASLSSMNMNISVDAAPVVLRNGPGGPVSPSNSSHSHYHHNKGHTSPTASHHRSSASASPPLQRTHSPALTDDDPILPHTQAYYQSLHSSSSINSHNHSNQLPSFIPSDPPQPQRPLPRSHSQPLAGSRSRSATAPSRPSPPNNPKPKSRPGSPSKAKSRPSSPSKAHFGRTTPPTHTRPSHTPSESQTRAAPSQSQSGPHRAASRSRTSSRPTTPSSSTAPQSQSQPQPGQGRTRIPQRPRAYSASAAEALETLAETPPPLPLPLASHTRALENALHTATTQPRLAFPGAPPIPTDAIGMSVSSSRAPEAPHRLGVSPGNGSGIPILKSRARSSPRGRSPSPDFPDSAERLADELPPFRVDLDAALAEIEDELEVRAQERYALALPAPRTPNSATFANVSSASTPTSTIGSSTPLSAPASKIRPPKQRQRPSLPVTNGNGSAIATPPSIGAARRGKRAGSVPLSNTPKTPKTSKEGLGRAASYSVSPDGRSKSESRKRHGSDTSQTLSINARPRPAPTMATPPSGRRGRGSTTGGTAATTSSHHHNSMGHRSNSITGPTGTPPMQSQSKLGVAAHFVPENTFTPPKGADWDDVVLPTVARKTGIVVASQQAQSGQHFPSSYSSSHSQAQSQSQSHSHSPDEDDLLAVEWDKEGTPIRWERQRKVSRPGLSEDDFTANRAAGPTAWNVDDFGAPTKRQSSHGQEIEMTQLPTPPTPAPAPVRPPRAAARASAQPSPQPPSRPQFSPPPQPPQPQFDSSQYKGTLEKQSHAQFYQTSQHQGNGDAKPHLVGDFQAQRLAGHGNHQRPPRVDDRRRKDDADDIKKGGCACVIM